MFSEILSNPYLFISIAFFIFAYGLILSTKYTTANRQTFKKAGIGYVLIGISFLIYGYLNNPSDYLVFVILWMCFLFLYFISSMAYTSTILFRRVPSSWKIKSKVAEKIYTESFVLKNLEIYLYLIIWILVEIAFNKILPNNVILLWRIIGLTSFLIGTKFVVLFAIRENQKANFSISWFLRIIGAIALYFTFKNI